jgi:hypothetical protein
MIVVDFFCVLMFWLFLATDIKRFLIKRKLLNIFYAISSMYVIAFFLGFSNPIASILVSVAICYSIYRNIKGLMDYEQFEEVARNHPLFSVEFIYKLAQVFCAVAVSAQLYAMSCMVKELL